MTRFATGAVTGGLSGMAAVFVFCAAVATVALATGRRIAVPWLFAASPDSANGAAAVSFAPDLTGLVVAVVFCAGLGAAAGLHRPAADPV